MTHAVEVDAEGRETRVLCGRVKLDNVADFYAPIDHDLAPECPVCLARDPRYR